MKSIDYITPSTISWYVLSGVSYSFSSLKNKSLRCSENVWDGFFRGGPFSPSKQSMKYLGPGSSVVEHLHGKQVAVGSIPILGKTKS